MSAPIVKYGSIVRCMYPASEKFMMGGQGEEDLISFLEGKKSTSISLKDYISC